MSDFSEFWNQQMKDDKMRRLMEETNAVLGRPQDGCKRIAEMDLTQAEEERIFRIMEDPRFDKAQDAILMKVLGKTKIARNVGAYRVRQYRKLFAKM